MGCQFVTTNMNQLLTHERTQELHMQWMTFADMYALTGEYRAMRNEMVSIMNELESAKSHTKKDFNDEDQTTNAIDTYEEEVAEKELEVEEQSQQDSHSICSTETSNDLLDYTAKSEKSKKSRKKVSDDDDDDLYTTVSMPYQKHESISVKVTETAVYADENDEDTFPDYMKTMPAEYVNARFCRLAYPTVVIENGSSNSFIRVRFQVQGDESKMEDLHFGVMNARGQYLRRLVSGSRHVLKEYTTDMKKSSDMFAVIHVKELLSDEGRQYELLLQFRDFSEHNMFEGHYRDLRIVIMYMTEKAIGSYDASAIFRVSPNQYYIMERRLPFVIQELKWDQEAPPVPPMMGVKPTMRIQLEKQQAFPVFKKMKSLF